MNVKFVMKEARGPLFLLFEVAWPFEYFTGIDAVTLHAFHYLIVIIARLAHGAKELPGGNYFTADGGYFCSMVKNVELLQGLFHLFYAGFVIFAKYLVLVVLHGFFLDHYCKFSVYWSFCGSHKETSIGIFFSILGPKPIA